MIFISKCKLKDINSCLMKRFILFKLTDVKISNKYSVFAFTEI